MKKKSLSSLAAQSPALVISVAALFFSLGSGAGYAATLHNHAATTTEHSGASVRAPHAVWTALKLLNGWKGDSYNSGAPAVWVSSAGVVYLRGSLYNTSKNKSEVVAVLPKNARPSHNLYLPIYTFGGSEGSAYLSSNGDLYVYGGSTTTASREYSSIAGITFPAGA
ncbi:MAG: hypothetical protein ABSE47_15210 [Acidimicrobiales bacterium]